MKTRYSVLNKPKPLPSIEELNEVFQITDLFPSGLIWKVNPSRQGGRKAGSMAGYMPKQGPQYWKVKYKQKSYMCHRIRWSLLNGRILLPEEYVDHADRDSTDNRKELRLVTRSQNQYNRTRVKNASGFRWVIYTRKNLEKPWRIMMKINGKLEYFGYYANPLEAAVKADCIAVEKLGVDYVCLNFPELQLKHKK